MLATDDAPRAPGSTDCRPSLPSASGVPSAAIAGAVEPGPLGAIVPFPAPAPREPFVLDAATLAVALELPPGILVDHTAPGGRLRAALSAAELVEVDRLARFNVHNVAHVRARHTDRRITEAAAYIRDRLQHGDHQRAAADRLLVAQARAVAAAQEAAQAADAIDVLADPPVSRGPLALDERIVLDGRPCRVTAIEGRQHSLIGKRGGRARLVAPDPAHEPLHPMLAMWVAWFGPGADHHCFRRDAGGAFVEERTGKARR